MPPIKRYGFLGPAGTFTEAALLTVVNAGTDGDTAETVPYAGADGDTAETVPYASVPAALDAVRRGECEAAMVAMENSVEGAVPATLDELAGEPLMIVREVLLPVSFALLVRPGTTMAAIRTVASHPHAQPQVRRWLAAELPQAQWESASSNAEAARLVAEGRFDAALAGAFAAPRYGLDVLVDGVHDVAGAVTRFVLVTGPGRPPEPTGADKTSLQAVLADDHPGALLELLEEFAVRGVNLVRIESRPTGLGLGRYYFSIDCEGHIADARVGEALMGLRRVCSDVRFLGSYERADGGTPKIRSGTSDPEFRDAEQWLGRMRRGEH